MHTHASAFTSFHPRVREGLTLPSRRNLLKAGLAGVAGLTLPDLLRARESGAAKKSVILLWMTGGPSQIDTFDPKPDRPPENRGPFGVTKTKLPGVLVCEHLPKLAGMLDRFTVIRSVDCRHSNHEPNTVMQTANLLAEARTNPRRGTTRRSAPSSRSSTARTTPRSRGKRRSTAAGRTSRSAATSASSTTRSR